MRRSRSAATLPHSQFISSFEIDSVSRSEVLRYLGYAGQEYSTELDDALSREIDRALAISTPKGTGQIFEVERMDPAIPRVVLKDTALVLDGEDMQKHLAGAKEVGVFAVTLGMANERELRRLSLPDRLSHVLFDAASVALVERAADAAEAEMVRRAAEEGLFCNWRFSPGYGDLPLETQPTLLAALNAQRLLGIALSPSLLMTPTKSVTALVGLFDEPQKSTHMSCAKCVCHDFCSFLAHGRTCHERRR